MCSLDDPFAFKCESFIYYPSGNRTLFDIKHFPRANDVKANFEPVRLFLNLCFVCPVPLVLLKYRFRCCFEMRGDFCPVTVLEWRTNCRENSRYRGDW